MSMTNKGIMSIITALVLISVTATVSSAVLIQCKKGTIVQAGIVPSRENTTNNVSKYVIKASCTDTTKWTGELNFTLSADLGDAGYATALTAVSTGGPIWINIEGAKSVADWWDNVTGIYTETTP